MAVYNIQDLIRFNVAIKIWLSNKHLKFTSASALIRYQQGAQSHTVRVIHVQRCRNSRRPLYSYHTGTPKQSLYRRDVYYRDVIKWRAIRATIAPGTSSRPLCHPVTPPRVSCQVVMPGSRFAEGCEVTGTRRAFLTVICHTDPVKSGSLPFWNLLLNPLVTPATTKSFSVSY